ncbi:hypothetical protein AB1Y20_001462 [Prymnesium parvum]|uniref:Sulfite exporter TauE/SafE n=1 Tax=Prymnesium parvum TaxID=97485 RepID=A0AB34KC38_PRYPA
MPAAPLLLALLLPSVHAFGRLLNTSSPEVCSKAVGVCACSQLAPGCGWCSSTKSCRPSSECTTTCRECPASHKTCRKSCLRHCVDTCALMTTVCGCSELDGCGWCSHAPRGEQCQPYPECSTTCDECDPSCSNHKYCAEKCFTRFRMQPDFRPAEEASLYGLRKQDLYTACATFTATVLASAAGIGGGSLLVPIFTLLGGFTEHEAIPLSKATIFGSSAFSVFGFMLWRRHPIAQHRTLIDYNVAALLIPPMLLGVTVGVYVNKMCPNWLIMVLAAAMCAYTGRRTVKQAFQKWKQESLKAERNRSDEAVPLRELDSGGSMDEQAEEEEPVPLEPLLPPASIFSILRAWVVVFSLGLLKGGHGAPSILGLQCGSPIFFLVVAANVPILVGLTQLARRTLLLKAQADDAKGIRRVKGDVVWDLATANYWCGFIGVSSIGAGMLGLGGGQIIKPVFNELDLLQEVSSATAALMMLFMSSTTVTQFILFGALETKFALFYGAVGALGSIVGNQAAKTVLDRTGRPSIGIFLLGFLLLGSGALMVVSGVPRLMQTGFTSFRPLCGRVGAAERTHD